MIAELLSVNLAGGAAVLLVLALRKPVRAAFGARTAYGLWSVVPLAMLAALAPRPAGESGLAPVVLALAGGAAEPARAAPDAGASLLALWLAGAGVALALLALRQARFMAEVRAGRAGPAVVGVLRPRIVTPADFEARFAAEERRLILAHEGVHLARGDAGVNAAAALAQCLCWFNPLAHVAGRVMRIDQELACDAAVVEAAPTLRKLYAEVLLKTQLAKVPLPIGCHWPASAHPLKERVTMLKSPLPAARRRAAGVAVVAAVGLAGACAAWAAQPGAAPTLITAPAWTERPTGDELAQVYPAAAKAQKLGGAATLDCRVGADGLLRECAVKTEAPAAAGFGQAALQLAPRFKMAATDRTGAATSGGRIEIPIRFMVP